jgi:hypothetical protein
MAAKTGTRGGRGGKAVKDYKKLLYPRLGAIKLRRTWGTRYKGYLVYLAGLWFPTHFTKNLKWMGHGVFSLTLESKRL